MKCTADGAVIAEDAQLAQTQSYNLNGAILFLRRGNPALALLLEAFQYATDLGRSLWDFAVEIDSLMAVGLTGSDLRWLVCKGLVEHGRECTMSGEQRRTFRKSSGLNFGKRTCFVLTDAGLPFARSATWKNASLESAPLMQTPSSDGSFERLAPKWDRDRQELRLSGVIVKQFKVPAANQETILAAFEEEHWPARVDDPLPPHPEQDSKRRLHDTINSLNRNQKQFLIRFLGDGSGQGVRWELATPSERLARQRKPALALASETRLAVRTV